MPRGLLRVRGTIDTSQFWPANDSDADTTKVIVDIGPEGFEFQSAAGGPFRRTLAFEHAVVASNVGRIAPVKDGRITVRLQGVDAPELHYRPPAELSRAERSEEQHQRYLEWSYEYRQRLAETAMLALAEHLGGFASQVACSVWSRVDTPNEVFDIYGRFVGDIEVTVAGAGSVLNEWLLEQGWGIPAFYASMTREEIDRLRALGDDAYDADRGVWPHYVDRIMRGAFDWDSRYRNKGAAPDPQHDPGSVLTPKLFRRLAAWAVNRRAGMAAGSFFPYLRSKRDTLHLRDEFVEQGPAAAQVYYLAELFDSKGSLQYWPDDIVFREQPSRLLGPDDREPQW